MLISIVKLLIYNNKLLQLLKYYKRKNLIVLHYLVIKEIQIDVPLNH